MDFSMDDFFRGLVRRIDALEAQVEGLQRANEALAHETVGMKRENAILRLEVALSLSAGESGNKRPRPGTPDSSISLFSVQSTPP